jgi:rubredoxin
MGSDTPQVDPPDQSGPDPAFIPDAADPAPLEAAGLHPGDPPPAAADADAADATAAVAVAAAVDPAALPAEPDPATHRFECRSCGFVYDPAEGVRKFGIEAGTPFLELDPASFRCPVCRSRMPAFKDIGPRDKPSGFEENLNFGLGVNRLTPGQKNVLIFGGFALAIAFFLSLYSLR